MIVELSQEQRLDEIVFSHYGNLEHLDAVIEVNQEHITNLVLEVGDKVELPTFASISNEIKIKTLWD